MITTDKIIVVYTPRCGYSMIRKVLKAIDPSFEESTIQRQRNEAFQYPTSIEIEEWELLNGKIKLSNDPRHSFGIIRHPISFMFSKYVWNKNENNQDKNAWENDPDMKWVEFAKHCDSKLRSGIIKQREGFNRMLYLYRYNSGQGFVWARFQEALALRHNGAVSQWSPKTVVAYQYDTFANDIAVELHRAGYSQSDLVKAFEMMQGERVNQAGYPERRHLDPDKMGRDRMKLAHDILKYEQGAFNKFFFSIGGGTETFFLY